ncbi:N-acetylglucosamine-6-phosphate deacetylase isoform X2 [Accipiter gentilis]|uniref:N-acetylglucosamine-6-phosphate deacetylase isoform X2 n=1 Tax=Astur gentilis TaxID=8957 RepID=UPI00210FB3EF|nr:N-acetylglucosamine-6-phosphate deacetylase isoform X2 [Accipiter gentilis]
MERAPKGTFQDELEWCVSQLEANLLCVSPTPKQAEETQHILKVLRSRETPFVKKQQAMNDVFGDYRLKMTEDQKSMKKADVKPGDVEVQQSNGQASDGVVYGKQSDQISEAKPKRFMSSDNSFRFDFTLSEIDPEATDTPLEAVPGVSGAEQIQTNVRATEQENWNGALSFAASGQEPKFAFNFAIPDEDCPLVHLVPASQHIERTADHEVLGNSLPTESAGMPRISALQEPELTPITDSAPKQDRSHVTLKIPRPETAPGDETVTEKSAADGAAQKKKKKKKQKPSVSKKEKEETEINRKAKAEANRCQNKDNSHQDETCQQSDDQLWKEVDWCVEQLELGLKTQKSTPKQVEEALRAIKTLRNDKAPLVKKRQLMRAMFGDYRKKMEEERCKELKLMEMAVKSARIVEVKGSIRNKNCRFIRKCSGACRKSQGSAGSPSESPRTLNTGSFKFTTSQDKFCFNFL